MTLKRYSLTEFSVLVESAHMVCFKEERPWYVNTFTFALMVEDDDGVPLAYCTCLEMDTASIYMQHGGAFPSAEKGPKTVRAYHKMIQYLRDNYERASTIIKNNNIAMIKLAYSAGFEIHGVDYMHDGIFLHLLNDFSGGKENGLVDSSRDGRGLNAPTVATTVATT